MARLSRRSGRAIVVAAGAAGALAVGGVAAGAGDGGSQAPGGVSVGRAVGQTIVTGFSGRRAPAVLLARIRDGHVGGVILFADNTAGGQAATRRLVAGLQAAAAAGNQPGLLVMTDQEGGEVRRLVGPPSLAASQMTSRAVAGAQGVATGRLLAGAGVNVDLAPVADVRRNRSGFLAVEHREFGSTAAEVAVRACAFADGLASAGVAPVLKHFPGLGTAVDNTDAGPVTIGASAGAIRGDDAAYRTCASTAGRPAGAPVGVMVSSATYPKLTGGRLPAVISPEIYRTELPVIDGVTGPTISDDLGGGALAGVSSVGVRAIGAGLDMLLYATDGGDVGRAYASLVAAARSGAVGGARLQAAAAAVLAFKRGLGLPRA